MSSSEQSATEGDLAPSDATAGEPSHEWPAGWYENPDSSGQRYWDGRAWTQSFHPGTLGERGGEAVTPRELLWGLALGFASVGVVGGVAIPLLAFYFPLGFGIAGAALGIAAATRPGPTPWYAAVAVLAILVSVGTGVSAYNEFSDNTEALQNLDF